MRTYQLDLLDETGRVMRTVDIVCVDDDEALLRADVLCHMHGIIVRAGLRRICDIQGDMIMPRAETTD